MNRDPLGLGVLLYGTRPVEGLTAAAWVVGPLAEREFELAHAGCSISTFCRNPLHPGPCKGWKKKLGTDAPGVLHALNKAHAEKLAVSRAKRSEAKSAAEKKLAGAQLHSPLRAKKATSYHANVLLGNDEPKAAGKAEKVILNKTEIKKYSKIKAAQMNALRAKHGLEEDPGLEERLAEAFADDNTKGNDVGFHDAVTGAAVSLGAQLAQKHCKEGDGDCDGKAWENLRDHLVDAADEALLTGDDSKLDGLLADYEAGKLDLTPAAPKPKIPQAAKAELLAKSVPPKPAGPPDGAVPKKLTLKQAGLQPGDKVWFHTHKGKGEINFNNKAPGDKPVLATVGMGGTINKQGATPGANYKTPSLYDEDGQFLGGGSPASKFWISPVDKPEFDEPSKPEAPKSAPAPASGSDGFHAMKAAQLFTGDGGGDHEVTPAKKLALLQAMSAEEYAGLPAEEKANIDAFLAHTVTKWPAGGSMNATLTGIQAKLGLGKKGSASDEVNALFATGASTGSEAAKKKWAALDGLTRAEFDKLGPATQGKVKDFLDAQLPGTLGHDLAAVVKKKLGVDVPTSAGIMSIPGIKVKEIFEGGVTVPDGVAVSYLEDIPSDDWNALPDSTKAKVKSFLEGIPADKPLTKEAANDLLSEFFGGAAPAPAAISPEAQHAANLATGAISGTAKQKLTAYEKISGNEFGQLPADAQKAVLADLLAVKDKFLDPKKKAAAQQHHDYLSTYSGGGAGAGGGGNPGASAVTLTPEEKHANAMAAIDTFGPLFSMPGSSVAKGKAGALDSVKESVNDLIKSGGLDDTAEILAPTWANTVMKKLAKMFGLDDMAIAQAKPALIADITKKLKGETGPTPHLDNLADAINIGDDEAAGKFLKGAIGANPNAHSPAASTTSLGMSSTPLGAFIPAMPGEYAATKSQASDGVLFSAFKSAHKGSVLSHSNEEIYNNLLAVAQHYAGKSPTSEYTFGEPEFSAGLSVLQVAKAVDYKIAQAKGVENENVLQKKMAAWSETPAGKQYITEHPTPGEKWSQNLAGEGSGSAQATKIGLVSGAPVGQRVQKTDPKRNGKAPKFDASKTADDFKPLTAVQISAAQQEYMDQADHQWTPGEAESLANYTTGAYYELNGYLRGVGMGGAPVNNISDLGLQRIALNQAGMRPLQQDTLLKRGTGWEFVPPEFRDPVAVQKLIGKTVQDHAFMSTTVGGEGGNFTDAVLLQIEAPKGTPSAWVKHISHNSSENEVVLAAGTRFKILSVEPGDKTAKYAGSSPTVIRVRVVG